MAKNVKGNTALAAAMAKAQGPVKPEYMPQDMWDVSSDEQKAFAADPANEAAVREAYEEGQPAEPVTPTEEGERAEMAVSDTDLPAQFADQTGDLAGKISEQDRAAFVDAVEQELQAKVRTVQLYSVITRAYGDGAVSLPRYGTTSKDGNLFDVFEYKKRTGKGTLAKKASEASVLEITAYKAMISVGMHNEIKELEKKISGLGKDAHKPVAWTTQLDDLRQRRNKLISKFVFAVRLVHQLADIADMERVGWNWIADDGSNDIKDDLSNLTTANACIMLYAKNKDGSKGMSIGLSPGTIIDYRVKWAKDQKESGTLDNLLASKDPGTPETTTTTADVEIQNWDEATRYIRSVKSYLAKFIGPAAGKTDAKAFHAYLMSDNGSATLDNIFDLVDMCEEGITSKDDMRSKHTANVARIERSMGGNANRQVKDQPSGAVAA